MPRRSTVWRMAAGLLMPVAATLLVVAELVPSDSQALGFLILGGSGFFAGVVVPGLWWLLAPVTAGGTVAVVAHTSTEDYNLWLVGVLFVSIIVFIGAAIGRGCSCTLRRLRSKGRRSRQRVLN